MSLNYELHYVELCDRKWCEVQFDYEYNIALRYRELIIIRVKASKGESFFQFCFI